MTKNIKSDFKNRKVFIYTQKSSEDQPRDLSLLKTVLFLTRKHQSLIWSAREENFHLTSLMRKIEELVIYNSW